MERLLQALGDTEPVRALLRDLQRRYAEPHRRYHDTRHLAEVLAAVDLLAGRDGAVPVAVVCAAYWHDAVYDPRAGDNEQRSADLAALALAGLGRAGPEVAEVVRLVLLTRTHRPAAGDRAGALLSDADLAVLAAGRERYGSYLAGVRAEYAHLDDEAFRRGRSDVLRQLLAAPRLYATEAGRRRWEAVARQNLVEELGSRRSSGVGP